MELTFKTEIKASKEIIWPYYASPSKRAVWEEDLECLVFNGEVKTGTTGKMKLKDMPEMEFELIKIVDEEAYWDRTIVPHMGSLIFGHDILQENGKVFIQHTVRLEKENAGEDDLEFLCGVFSDVPGSIMKIKREVEK